MFKKLTKNVVLNKGIYFKIKNLDLSKPLVEEGDLTFAHGRIT